ncbi:guanylate-binding protein 5 [Oryctolagus cuniculus]|uniref:guanylate-binding protein 5 n=1 Tax=Oryctolagus cuniculus TaxID=9986 RepID=UPI003879641F
MLGEHMPMFSRQNDFLGLNTRYSGPAHLFPCRQSNVLDMASEILMAEPVCLIENTSEQFMVNEEAVQILLAVTQPMVVVAIVGLYRTGKSYLMNKLAGKKQGFSVGSTVQSHTKGIWMWCVPHPEKPEHTLVLLDTEGLADVEKVDNKNDTQIFALAILVSSVFVYNTMNKIDQGAVDLLNDVTELTDLLKVRTSPDLDEVEDTADLVSFFPDLVWTLRDFYLCLETDGQLITADEYLENSLKLKEGTDQRTQAYNFPRKCIKKFFPTRKCFIFDLPTNQKKLAQLQILHDDELECEFVQQMQEFCSYIFSHSMIKTLPGGIKVNGPRLENLVMTYVNAINRGDLPCIENSVLTLAQVENTAAVQKAIAHYDQQMSQKVHLPTETLQELLDLHTASQREAIEVFMKDSFKDMDQKFQKELETLLDAKHDAFCKRNLEASSDLCSALLQDIFGPLEEAVKQGTYSKPGGYNLYLQKTEELKAEYYQKPRKGIQAEEALQKYLKSKESVSATILKTDQALTAREEKMKKARRQAEVARAEAERLKAIQRENQRLMEEQERRHQKEVRQMEMNRARMLQKQQRAKERRLQIELAVRKKDREKGLPSVGSPPKWPPRPELRRSEARSQVLPPGLPRGCRGPSTGAILHCTPRPQQRAGQEEEHPGLEASAHMGCRHRRRRIIQEEAAMLNAKLQAEQRRLTQQILKWHMASRSFSIIVPHLKMMNIGTFFSPKR